MTRRARFPVATTCLIFGLAAIACGKETPANRFVEVSSLPSGGHYFSQMIYAPTAEARVYLCETNR